MDSYPTFKVLLVGDRNCGKSAFIKRHHTGEFVQQHIPTTRTNVTSLIFYTNMGPAGMQVWEINPDDDIFGDVHCVGASCAMIMFDVTSQESFESVPFWHDMIRNVCGNDIPLVLIGNKVDVPSRTVRSMDIIFQLKSDALMQYYCVSAKSNYNFEKPFLWLIQKLANDSSLMFVVPYLQSYHATPGSLTIAQQQVLDFEFELTLANLTPLPPPDDDEI
eukprot:PhF_6_TR26971/c0_g1_i1/m.39343/K07936/RAN; GTP-binding nuclear protein Ran